jgi:hypothetical protein
VSIMEVGTVVRDRIWGGRCTGTVVATDGSGVFVAWHGSFVEDQLDAGDVEVWSDAPSELRAWRGGLARYGAAAEPIRIVPILDAR